MTAVPESSPAAPAARPWFVGAWRRRSITIPGGSPVEPCDAWWLQTNDVFVDVRVTRDGHDENGMPYSSTRAFAGRFEIADGEIRWHLALDSHGPTPHTDRAPAGGLFLDPDEPGVMIEDAPGRFREVWVRHKPVGPIEVVHTDSMIAVRIGDIGAVVQTDGQRVDARLWLPDPARVFDVSSVAGPAQNSCCGDEVASD